MVVRKLDLSGVVFFLEKGLGSATRGGRGKWCVGFGRSVSKINGIAEGKRRSRLFGK